MRFACFQLKSCTLPKMSETSDESEYLPITPVKTLEQWAGDAVAKLSDDHLLGFLAIYLESISATNREELFNSSSIKYINFPLNLSLVLFTQEKYWQKRCFEMNWTLVHYWFYFCNWKSTFVSRYAEELIDNFICGNISFQNLLSDLLRFKDHLFTLKINGFKLKYFSDSFQKFTAQNGDVLLEDSILTIIDLFPKLKELYFNNIPINYELTLNSKGNDLTDGCIKRLGSTLSTKKTLQKVSLIGTDMKTPQFCEMLRSISSLRNLVDLNLSCNSISDDLCEDIAQLLPGSKIQKLILSNNKIGSAGAKHFSRVLMSPSMLNSLYLDQNVIDDEGASFLAKSLLRIFSVSKLDISHNKITAVSTDFFCDLLRNNCSLEYLNLAGNYLGKVSGIKIFEAVKRNRTLKFFGHHFCGFEENDEDNISLHVAQNYKDVEP